MLTRKKGIWFTIIALICIVIAFSSASALSNKPDYDTLFQRMKAKLSQPGKVSDSEVLATIGDYAITFGDFRQRQANVEFMTSAQNRQATMTNSDILKELIKEKITLAYAQQNQVIVSDEDVFQYITDHRQLISATDNQDIKDINRHLILKSGLSEEDYWNSAETMNSYRYILLTGKVVEKLMDSGKITSYFEYEQFLEDELISADNIVINNERLSNL